LFVDHLSKLKRDIILKKLKKFVRSNQKEMAESHVII